MNLCDILITPSIVATQYIHQADDEGPRKKKKLIIIFRPATSTDNLYYKSEARKENNRLTGTSICGLVVKNYSEFIDGYESETWGDEKEKENFLC